jgi:hypothetical protein
MTDVHCHTPSVRMGVSQTFCPGQPRTAILPLRLPCSWDDKLMPLHPAIGWDEVSWTFCPSWPQTTNLPISASQVARIIGMDHWCLVEVNFFMVWGKGPTSFFSCGYPVVQHHLLRRLFLLPLNYLGTLIISHLIVSIWVYFRTLSYTIGLYVYPYSLTTLPWLKYLCSKFEVENVWALQVCLFCFFF